MEKISCEIINDLLPLYCDNVCTPDSRLLVEAHLQGCADCRSLLEKMQKECCISKEQEQQEEIILKNMASIWKKSISKSFIKGLLAAFCILLLLSAGCWGLTRWPVLIVPPDAVDASAVISGSSSVIYMRAADGYKCTSMDLTATDDGKMYIFFKRGIIPIKDGDGATFGGTYTIPLTMESESGKMVQIKEIYYGTEGDCALLWEK